MVNVVSEPIITPARVRPSSSGSATNTGRVVSGIPRWTGKASASGSSSNSRNTSSIVKKKKAPLGERSDVDNSLSVSQSSQTSQSASTKMKPKVKPTLQRPSTGINAKAPRFSLAITSTPRNASSRKPPSQNANEETPLNPPPRTVGGSTPHPRYSLPRLSMGDDTMLMDMSMSGLDADFLDTDASDVEQSDTGRKGRPAKGRSGMVGGLMTPANSQEVETHSPRQASPDITAKRTFDPVYSRLPTPPSSQANDVPTPPRNLDSRIRPRPSPTPPRRVSTDPSATLGADIGLAQDPSPNPRRKKTPRVEATGSPVPARTSPSLSQSQRVRQRFEVVITPRAPLAKSAVGKKSISTPVRSPPLASQSSVTYVNGIPVRTFAAPSTAPPAVRRPRSSLAASTRKRAVTPKTVQAKPRSKPSPPKTAPKTAPKSSSRARQSMTPSAIKALAGRKLGITPKPLKGSPGDDPLLLVGWEEDPAVRNSRLRTELEAERVDTEAESSTAPRERSVTPRPEAIPARNVDDPPPLAADAHSPREPTPAAETTYRLPSPSPAEDHDLTLHGFSHLGEDFDGVADLDPGFGSDTDFEDEGGIGNDTFVHVRARMGMSEQGDISGLQALVGPSDGGSSSITLAPKPLDLRPPEPSSPMLPQLAGTSFSPLRSPSLALRGSSILPDHIEDSFSATPTLIKDQGFGGSLGTGFDSDVAITVRLEDHVESLQSSVPLTIRSASEPRSDAGDLEGDTILEAEAGGWDLSNDQSPALETGGDTTLAPHASTHQVSQPHRDAEEDMEGDTTVETLAELSATTSGRMVSPEVHGGATPAPVPPVEAARQSPEVGIEVKKVVAGIDLQVEELSVHDVAGARSAPASPVSLSADEVEPVESPAPVTTPLPETASPVELQRELPTQDPSDMHLDAESSLEADHHATFPSPHACPGPVEQVQLATTVAIHPTDQLDGDGDRLTAELEDGKHVRSPTPARSPAPTAQNPVELIQTTDEEKREDETPLTPSASPVISAVPLEKEVSTTSPKIVPFRHSPSLVASVVPQLDDNTEPEAVDDHSQEGDLTLDAQSADWDLSDEAPLDLPEGAQDGAQDLAAVTSADVTNADVTDADVTNVADVTANTQDNDEVVFNVEQADDWVSTGSLGLHLPVESNEVAGDLEEAVAAPHIFQVDFAVRRLDVEAASQPVSLEEAQTPARDEDSRSQRLHIERNEPNHREDIEEQDHEEVEDEVPENEENEAGHQEETAKIEHEAHLDAEEGDEDGIEDEEENDSDDGEENDFADEEENDFEDEVGGDDQEEQQEGEQAIQEGKKEGEVQADQARQAEESASQVSSGNADNTQREEPTSVAAQHHTPSERIVLKLVPKGVVKIEPEDLGTSSRDIAPASPAFSSDEAPLASSRAARLSIPHPQVCLEASPTISGGLQSPLTSTSPTTEDRPRVDELDIPVQPNIAEVFSVQSSNVSETNATLVSPSAIPTTAAETHSTQETTTPALSSVSLPSESASFTPKSDPPLAAFHFANAGSGGVPALERMLWRNTAVTHVPSRLAIQVTDDTPSTPPRESPASDDEDDDTELRGSHQQGRDDEEDAGDRSVRIRSARKSLHDELAGADGDASINSVVEVASLDPRAAARAAAILKLNHAYIEHGVLPSSSTPRRTPRRRSIHESSFFGSIESARKLTKDELLHEAELEIVASRSQRARSASVLSTMTSATAATAATAATGYSELQLPGGWVRTPKRKRSDPVTQAASSSSVPIAGTKEIKADGKPWGVPEWKRLEKVFRREREAWIKEREVKALPGGLVGWAKRMSTGPKKVVEWDEERVVARFYKDEGIEKEMGGEWARDVLLLRVRALERRVIDKIENHTSEPSTERSPKKAKVDGMIVPSTPGRSLGVCATEPPSTIKRAFGWMMGWNAQNSLAARHSSAGTAKADAPLREDPVEEAVSVPEQPEDDLARPEGPTQAMKQVPADRTVSGVAAQLESAGRTLRGPEIKDDRRSSQQAPERQAPPAPFTPAHPSSSSWTPPLRPLAPPSVRPAVSALSLTSTLTASRSLPADLSASTSTIATYLNTPAPRLYPSLDPPLTQRSSAIKALFPDIHPLGSSTDSAASTSSATSRPEPLPMPAGIKKRDSVKDLIRSFQEKGVLDKAFQAKDRRQI